MAVCERVCVACVRLCVCLCVGVCVLLSVSVVCLSVWLLYVVVHKRVSREITFLVLF